MGAELGTRAGAPGRVLVTGASRGIGRAIASALARRGWEVIATARDPSSVSTDASMAGVRFLPLDLTIPHSIDSLVSSAGEIDVLVNNAGGSQIGPIEEVPPDAVRALFEQNFFGAVRLTQAFLPLMRARGRGRILFISSFAGVTPVPFLSVYAATKAALTALGRGLRQEVRGAGIQVSVIAPFDIRTSIPLDLRFRPDSPYLASLLRVKDVRDRALAEAPEPGIVADLVLKVLSAKRPRAFYPVGRRAGLQAFLLRHLPDALVETLVLRVFRLNA